MSNTITQAACFKLSFHGIYLQREQGAGTAVYRCKSTVGLYGYLIKISSLTTPPILVLFDENNQYYIESYYQNAVLEFLLDVLNVQFDLVEICMFYPLASNG